MCAFSLDHINGIRTLDIKPCEETKRQPERKLDYNLRWNGECYEISLTAEVSKELGGRLEAIGWERVKGLRTILVYLRSDGWRATRDLLSNWGLTGDEQEVKTEQDRSADFAKLAEDMRASGYIIIPPAAREEVELEDPQDMVFNEVGSPARFDSLVFHQQNRG